MDIKEILSKGISIDRMVEALRIGESAVSDEDWHDLSEDEFNKIVENAKSIGWTTDDDYGSSLFQCCDGPHFSILFRKSE